MIDKTRARIWVFFLKILVIITLPKKPKEKTIIVKSLIILDLSKILDL
jgi:hypothetical protein